MAKRNIPNEVTPPSISPEQGIRLLSQLINKGKDLLEKRPLQKDDYSSWELLARNYLEKSFGKNSPNVSTITSVGKYGSFPMNTPEGWWENHRVGSLETQLKKLEGLTELLETEIQLVSNENVISSEIQNFGDRVFLVHGHDEGLLHEVARFLEKLKLKVIILREQANEGKTIIEKFLTYSEVGFAVILLTPDDKGGHASQPFDQQKYRARQNVIFELGFFIGKLSRNRVCALYEEDVEIPSDYSGVLFVKMDDNGSWKLNLAKEMKAAGLPIDMNKAF